MTDICIDFGGTNIKIGLVQDGEIAEKTSISAFSEEGVLPRLPIVKSEVIRLLEGRGLKLANCGGIGIAMPGIIDSVEKKVTSINGKYRDAVGFAFERWIHSEFGLPSVLENDARAALVGETAHGAAKGAADAVLMIFGTGIGTAAMIGGRVVRGRHHQAGILGGHMATDVHGHACNCGNLGCLEAQASHRVLSERAMQDPLFGQSSLSHIESLGYLSIVEHSVAGDRLAAEMLDELIVHWSAGIVNLIHAYDPEIVVLSGGLMKSAETIVPRLSERVHRLAWTPWGKVRFTVAKDPDTSVLMGLSHLIHSHA